MKVGVDKHGEDIFVGDTLRTVSSMNFTNTEDSPQCSYKTVKVEFCDCGLAHYRPFYNCSKHPNDFSGIGSWEKVKP